MTSQGDATRFVSPFPLENDGRVRTKQAARQHVWDHLEAEGFAAFPFPPHGRIPNFVGASIAADRLLDIPQIAAAKRIKVNPDAPQPPVKSRALQHGKTIYVPTPRLRGGFKRLDPDVIPPEAFRKAASLSGMDEWADDIPVHDLPAMDAIVCGSVAVDALGHRCGKGEGYSDIEYAILRELGHPPAPVYTTVHDAQVLASIPRDDNDLPLAGIVTPTRTLLIDDPLPAPRGINWSRLTEEDLDEMPLLKDLLPTKGSS
ncbi:MAG: 5-formyltetrahydrofolate cyclo-ligase [Gemmatimonadetes bacterium]|nr:5-formyltetrahydrofolate cyclo-ligase [Gemmatimonadota bacterium]